MKPFIYNQTKIPKDQWRYGLRSSAATGCGWIATYNALHLLGWDAEIPDLISYYEHQLPLIHGTCGTSFWGPALCFRQWGFPTKMHFDSRTFDAAAREAPASILLFYWKKGVKIGAHFVALHHDGNQFVGFNTFRHSVGPDRYGPSLTEFLRRQHYFGAVLITIEKKRS